MATVATLLFFLSCMIILQVDSQYCREGWHYHKGSCYGFGETPVTWPDAVAICKEYNAKLAEIETSDENEFLKNIAKDKQASYTFLGGTDMFDEGIWEWASSGNHIYPFTDWVPSEPNDDGAGEDCLSFSGYGHQWNDVSCTLSGNFICEAKSTEGTIVG